MKLSIVIIILLSCISAQRVQLFTKSNDIFTSSNQFDVKNREVVFMEEDIVLTTIPIKNLIEVRYAEKSYKYIGSPCVFLGSLILASTAGLGAAGQIKTAYLDTEQLIIGLGSGFSLYFFGKLLKTIGVRFGKDVIYEDFDRLSKSTKTLILESISLDMKKKEKAINNEK